MLLPARAERIVTPLRADRMACGFVISLSNILVWGRITRRPGLNRFGVIPATAVE